VASKRPYESTLAFFLLVEIWFVSYTQFLAEQDGGGDDLFGN
jgi:RpiR family glv operon transcriptional regulator